VAAHAQRVPKREDIPRSLADWAIDAAFELDEALKGRSADADLVDGFFHALLSTGPYQKRGHNIVLIDAVSRDRLRSALREVLDRQGTERLTDVRIQEAISELTDTKFKQRLKASLHKDRASKISAADKGKVERLRKFMLRLHDSLISDWGVAPHTRDWV